MKNWSQMYAQASKNCRALTKGQAAHHINWLEVETLLIVMIANFGAHRVIELASNLDNIKQDYEAEKSNEL